MSATTLLLAAVHSTRDRLVEIPLTPATLVVVVALFLLAAAWFGRRR